MKYWWYKLANGGGIVPATEAQYFLDGRFLHDDLSMFAEGRGVGEILALMPTEEILTRGDQLEMEGHWRRMGWVTLFGELIWPYLMEHFEVVKYEWEIILQRDPLWIAIKPDLILRNKKTGKLIYIEYKTTATIQSGFATHWPYASQLHLGMKAVEEELGEKVDYAQVIGFYKGRYGYGRLQNRLVWGYFNDTTQQWSGEYQRATGWRPRPVWEYDPGVQGWVSGVLSDQQRRELFVWSEPVYLDDRQLIHIVERRKYRQEEIERVKGVCGEDEILRNIHFEKRTTECKPIWGSECPYLACCFNKSVGDNPLKSGLFVPRTPHHEVELVGEF